jgi:hypothetical protein
MGIPTSCECAELMGCCRNRDLHPHVRGEYVGGSTLWYLPWAEAWANWNVVRDIAVQLAGWLPRSESWPLPGAAQSWPAPLNLAVAARDAELEHELLVAGQRPSENVLADFERQTESRRRVREIRAQIEPDLKHVVRSNRQVVPLYERTNAYVSGAIRGSAAHWADVRERQQRIASRRWDDEWRRQRLLGQRNRDGSLKQWKAQGRAIPADAVTMQVEMETAIGTPVATLNGEQLPSDAVVDLGDGDYYVEFDV